MLTQDGKLKGTVVLARVPLSDAFSLPEGMVSGGPPKALLALGVLASAAIGGKRPEYPLKRHSLLPGPLRGPLESDDGGPEQVESGAVGFFSGQVALLTHGSPPRKLHFRKLLHRLLLLVGSPSTQVYRSLHGGTLSKSSRKHGNPQRTFGNCERWAAQDGIGRKS